MTPQDEIIEMARQAGMEQDGDMWFSNLYKTDMDVHISHLETFAKLVAAKEREACAKVADEYANGLERNYSEIIADAIRARGEQDQNICPKCRSFFCDNTCKVIAELESQEPVIDKSAAKRIATSLGWSPQRTWVGLTDDEFNKLYDRYVPLTCYALLIEKVEAKLKQKNGYFEEKNT
jgi:hypothetical protein